MSWGCGGARLPHAGGEFVACKATKRGSEAPPCEICDFANSITSLKIENLRFSILTESPTLCTKKVRNQCLFLP